MKTEFIILTMLTCISMFYIYKATKLSNILLRKKRIKQKVNKPKRLNLGRKRWKLEEINYLLEHMILKTPLEVVSKNMDRSVMTIFTRLNKEGFKTSDLPPSWQVSVRKASRKYAKEFKERLLKENKN